MDAITVSQHGEFEKNKPVRRRDYEPLPLRWKAALDLRLSGMKVKEISKRLGFSIPFVYHILNDERTLRAKQFLFAQTQEEFEALFEEVTDAVKRGLRDPEKYLEAANMWLKANGKFAKSEGITMNVTAEDVVMQIMNGDVNQSR